MKIKKILHIFEIDVSTDFIQKSLSQSSNLNYENLLTNFFEYKYSWSNTIKNNFKHYDVEIVIGNSKYLQLLWIKEFLDNNTMPYNKFSILKEQIKFYRPEAIIFQNLRTFEYISKFLEKNKIKSIVYDGVGFNSKFVGKKSDVVFSCISSTNDFYKKLNKNSLYLPHGFDETIIINNNKNNQIIFIGSISNKGHFDRTIFLNEISKNFKINLWLGKKPDFFQILKNLLYNIFFNKKLFMSFKYLKAIKKLHQNNLGNLFGIYMYKHLSESLITINYHIDKVNDEAANMRIFESTGSGVCLITENKSNLKNFFDIDKEIVVYDNLEDAIKKIKYYLTNKDIALKIGKNARLKTLNQHTMASRWNKLENFLIKSGI